MADLDDVVVDYYAAARMQSDIVADSTTGAAAADKAPTGRDYAAAAAATQQTTRPRKNTAVSSKSMKSGRSRKSDGQKPFNWELEDFETSTVEDRSFSKERTRRCQWFFNFTASLPLWLNTLINIIVGDAIIFACIGIPDLLNILSQGGLDKGFLNWESKLNIGNMPLFHWSIYLCISWTLFFLCRFAISVIPGILNRIVDVSLGSYYSEYVEDYLNYLLRIRKKLYYALWLILSFVAWVAFIGVNWSWKSKGSDWTETFARVLLVLFVGSALWAAEKLMLEVIATRFHRRAYGDRIRVSKFANSVLTKLSVALTPGKPTEDESEVKSQDTLNNGVAIVQKAGNFIRKTAQKAVKNIGNELKNVIDPFANATTFIPPPGLPAAQLAKALFEALITSPEQDEIVVENFLPYFSSEKEAQLAFSLFDKDGNGDISKSEMRNVITEIAIEKQSIEDSLCDVAKAVGALDYFLGAIFVFLYILLAFTIFKVPVETFISTILAFLLPTTFIFGASLKNTFESIIFLFITHPFDVGDRVDIDTDSYVVKSMSINSTALTRIDGKVVYAPNTVLANKFIHNVRRSGRQSEKIVLKVDIKTSNEEIGELEKRLILFLREHNRDFIPKLSIVIQDVLLAENVMLLTMNVEHKSNFQDGGKKIQRRNRFMHALRDTLEQVGINCPASGAAESVFQWK